MNLPFHQHRLVAIALFAMGASLCSAQTAGKDAKAADVKSKAAADAQKLTEQANAQRATMISETENLVKQLKDATDEQRKAILAKLEEKQKAFAEAQAAMHKQMKVDMRRQRQNAAPKH